MRRILPGKRSKSRFVITRQASIERLENVLPNIDSAKTTIGEVKFVHMDRMTVDIQTNNGMTVKNVQILTKGGLVDTEVWGELEVPEVGTSVVVAFINGNAGYPFILGYLFPYGYSKYQSNQTPVNSGSKAYTKKLLEDVDPKTYRRIFKSGTTVEVKADGTTIIETPSGDHVKINGTGGITIEGSSNITIKGGTVTVEASTLLKLKSGDATAWAPCILPNCLMTGAPQGGVPAGIVKLKGG